MGFNTQVVKGQRGRGWGQIGKELRGLNKAAELGLIRSNAQNLTWACFLDGWERRLICLRVSVGRLRTPMRLCCGGVFAKSKLIDRSFVIGTASLSTISIRSDRNEVPAISIQPQQPYRIHPGLSRVYFSQADFFENLHNTVTLE